MGVTEGSMGVTEGSMGVTEGSMGVCVRQWGSMGVCVTVGVNGGDSGGQWG